MSVKVNVWIGVIVLTVIVIPMVYSMVHYLEVKIDNSHEPEFRQTLIQAVSEGEPFDMRALTSFDWDRMMVFYPYTSLEEMERVVGREWTSDSYFGYYLFQKTFLGDYPLDDDVYNKLVFMLDDQVVLDTTFNRGDVDLTQLPNSLLPEDAMFQVEDSRMILGAKE